MIKEKKQIIIAFLIIVTAGLFLSACSSSDDSSGGASSGIGSSSVQGNVSYIKIALNQTAESDVSTLASLMQFLMPITSAHADSGVDGIIVRLGTMQTVTDGNGYFRFDGVPPGTHQMSFEKNGQISRTTITVGTNEQVTMHNIRIDGSHAIPSSVDHTPMEGTPHR